MTKYEMLITPSDLGKRMYNVLEDRYYTINRFKDDGLIEMLNIRNEEDGHKHIVFTQIDCKGRFFAHGYKANPIFIWNKPFNDILDFWNLPEKEENPVEYKTNPQLNKLQWFDESYIGKFMFDVIENVYVKILEIKDDYIILVRADGSKKRHWFFREERNVFPRLVWNKPNIYIDNYMYKRYKINWNKLPTKEDKTPIHLYENESKINFEHAIDLQELEYLRLIKYEKEC